MDDPQARPDLVVRSLSDVALANRLFGGSRAVVRELMALTEPQTQSISVIDVGTGIGDIPACAAAAAGRKGIRIEAVGLDASEASLRLVRERSGDLLPVRGDALRLPFRDAAFDVAVCSQVLHHFLEDESIALIREMDRVSRTRVIVSDIRRSWFAAAGIWIASFPLGFHPISRHDGVVSVFRGFTSAELRSIVHRGVGVVPRVIHRAGFRITASWIPSARTSIA